MGEQLVLSIEEFRRREDVKVRHAHDIERLGGTHEWGSLMLKLLEASGLEVNRFPAFAGGVSVEVRIGPLTLGASGAEIADFATDLFVEAIRLRSFLAAGDA